MRCMHLPCNLLIPPGRDYLSNGWPKPSYIIDFLKALGQSFPLLRTEWNWFKFRRTGVMSRVLSGEFFKICEFDWSMRHAIRKELLDKQMECGAEWSSGHALGLWLMDVGSCGVPNRASSTEWAELKTQQSRWQLPDHWGLFSGYVAADQIQTEVKLRI